MKNGSPAASTLLLPAPVAVTSLLLDQYSIFLDSNLHANTMCIIIIYFTLYTYIRIHAHASVYTMRDWFYLKLNSVKYMKNLIPLLIRYLKYKVKQ